MKLMTISIGIALLVVMVITSFARDTGQWAQASPEQREFFNNLRNKNNVRCCFDNDGFDAKWEVRGDEYWVEIEGEFRRVPPKALLDIPNKYGVAKVWYTKRWDAGVQVFAEVTCFLRGTES